MMVLIENGELYAPEPLEQAALLIVGDKIVKIGEVDRQALDALALEYEYIDATDCVVTPGLIDPHEHLLGGSGERGFSTQTPEITLREIVTAGITTVVGCLGVDTSMKTMAGLLAKAKALREDGLTAYIWSGGYDVPPITITKSVRDDLLFIDEVIGAGEIAISDIRATSHDLLALARLVSDAYVGGLLSGKAGITHVHVGDEPGRLQPLRKLVEKFSIRPEWLYPTHIERNEALLREAIEWASRGAFVDIDVVENDLAQWLRFYREHGGDMRQLTLSSDAAITSPRQLYEQLRLAVLNHGFNLADVLPLLTTNPARALRLSSKGRLADGYDADVLVMRQPSLALVEVIARGRRLVQEGKLTVIEGFAQSSGFNRKSWTPNSSG
ncbi:MAG: amidohydrolase family protein [Blastocatellia bacterium]